MRRVLFSQENLPLEEILEWYSDTLLSLNVHMEHIIDSLLTDADIPEKFIGMTPVEIHHHFDDLRRELELLTCFDLLAATEAWLRIDFLRRVYDKRKDDLSKLFRGVYKEWGLKTNLSEHILQHWVHVNPSTKIIIGDFRSALGFRHWLAHGRYWTPKLGRIYDVNGVFRIAAQLISELQKTYSSEALP